LTFMSEVVLLLPHTGHKLKIMSEVVLLLPNTDCLQQVEDYVRDCIFLPNTFPLAICDFQTTFLKTRIKATEV
jgi:hypothetical protein